MSERFGKGGIADRMIWFNGFPFLDNKEEHTFGVPVSQVMTSDVTALPSTGLDLRALEKMLTQNKYQGFPIVDDRTTQTLFGYIGRTELRYAIDRIKRDGLVSPSARCHFGQPESITNQTPSIATPAVTFEGIESSLGQQSIDFSRFIDPTPLTVHPRLSLETVMEVFKKMGPRVILVEHRGRLAGLVTVKDCLKYQFTVEAHDISHEGLGHGERQEKLWAAINAVAGWITEKTTQCTGGRIKLQERGRRMSLITTDNHDPRDQLLPIRAMSPHAILDGTEDVGEEVEMQVR